MLVAVSTAAAAPGRYSKLDDELNRRAASAAGSQTTSVIVRVTGNQLPPEFKKFARPGVLSIVDGYVLDVPNAQLKAIGTHASTLFASHNTTVHAFNFRTGVQSGAFFARRMLGFSGAGVGVAVLDSGFAPVDDFDPIPGHRSRGIFFKDFLDPAYDGTGGCLMPCDFNGHGTHVAGTISGSGFDSNGQNAGMAPDASLVALRVLGRNGSGPLSGVLDALGWVLAHAKEKNIRVVNLSFGMAPTGELPDHGNVAALLEHDPLARATKALVDAGIFVVAAAGNLGQIACADLPPSAHPHAATGKCDVWGGITAPGTYPWVFTAGANSSKGTFSRADDARASFSSRGPAFPLENAKPDVLAGGVGIESTAAPGSALYQAFRAVKPYLITYGNEPTRERLQSAADRERFDDTTKCILCAACTSSCPVFWADGSYFGPAAIVNAHRFIFDSRDEGAEERLDILNDAEGVWRCRTTFNCTDACPRGIQVTKAIQEVKRALLFKRV